MKIAETKREEKLLTAARRRLCTPLMKNSMADCYPPLPPHPSKGGARAIGHYPFVILSFHPGGAFIAWGRKGRPSHSRPLPSRRQKAARVLTCIANSKKRRAREEGNNPLSLAILPSFPRGFFFFF